MAEASWASWRLRDYPAPQPLPVKKRVAPPPTQVYLNLEDPLNLRVVAYTIPTATPSSKSPGTPRRSGTTGKRITVFPSAKAASNRLPWSHTSPQASRSRRFDPYDVTSEAAQGAVASAPIFPQLLGTPPEESAWGPAAPLALRQTAPSSLSHLAATFTDENKYSKEPPLASFSHEHHYPEQQQRKLEQWRRHRLGSQVAVNGDVLAQHASAASRSWADDGTHVPHTFQSRSASVVSAVSCDSAHANQRPLVMAENGTSAPAKPPWVNPTDSSATQTETVEEMLPHSEDLVCGPTRAGGLASGSCPTDRNDDDAVESMQTKDGWETWATHRPLARLAAAASTSGTAGAAKAGKEEDDRLSGVVSSADSSSDAEGSTRGPSIRLASIIRGTPRAASASTSVPVAAAVNTSESPLGNAGSGSSAVTDVYVRELQRQQEDMVALVLKQQRQIEELRQRQDAPSGTRNPPNEDAPVFSGAAARLGLAHEEEQPRGSESAQYHPVTSDRSAAAPGTHKKQQSKTVQTPQVVVRNVFLDEDFDFDRQVERERILLRGILDADLKARQLDDDRQRSQAANLHARQELSRKLARHFAKPKQRSVQHIDEVAAPKSAPSPSSSASLTTTGLLRRGDDFGSQGNFRAPAQQASLAVALTDSIRPHSRWQSTIPPPSAAGSVVVDSAALLSGTFESDATVPASRELPASRSTQVTPVLVAEVGCDFVRETAETNPPPPSPPRPAILHGNHESTFLQLRDQYLSLRGKSRSASTDSRLASATTQHPPASSWQRV